MLLPLFAVFAVGQTAAAAAASCWRDYECTGPAEASFAGEWDANSFSPASRTVHPVKILNLEHEQIGTYPKDIPELSANTTALIFDFGVNTGGILTLDYTTSDTGTLGLAFSEASNFTGPVSDESNGGSGPDNALTVNLTPTGSGRYEMPLAKLRGGFRYVTVFTNCTVSITGMDLEIAFQPTWSNLQAYGGYFHSSDQLLNRIWYANAYTIQLTSVPSETGREYPLSSGWANDKSLGLVNSSILVDGAKRDRSAWPGDLLVAIPSLLVSTGDIDTARNALVVEFDNQKPTGELPYAGPPLYFYGSDAYHMISLISTYDYMLFSNDIAFLQAQWDKYLLGVDYIASKIDASGLLSITSGNSWGRAASSTGRTTDGNAMLYRILTNVAPMAAWAGVTADVSKYAALAVTLKTALNSDSYNWDPAVGAFKNKDSDASVYPEDGNSLAIMYGAVNASRFGSISDRLTKSWGSIGSVCPEGQPGIVSPFCESLELQAHLTARQPQRALDLMRLSWGWYINSPYGTGSSMIEGYRSDGSFHFSNDGYNRAGSYPSHAHGWSTGPASTLVNFVAGIRPSQPGGKSWILEPQFGDLTSAQGGFTTPVGKFSSGWSKTASGYDLWVDTPASTNGTVTLVTKNCSSLTLDGKKRKACICDKTTSLAIFPLPGGKHTLSVNL